MLVISEYFMFNVWKILAGGYCMHVFLVSMYNAFVLPHFNYCSTVWKDGSCTIIAAVRQLPILHVCLTQSFARHIYWQDLDRMCPGVCPQLRGNYYSGSFLNKGGGQTLFCIVLA